MSRSRLLSCPFLVLLGLVPPAAARSVPVKDLTRLTLEELAALEVTSVSKRPEPLRTAPAAVTVITGEDLRRTGARTLVEALRLAPGVHVAGIDANKWAVGVRGFTTRLARSTLVLIDGRSVYNPLFAGTYWEVQDTLLDDVDRIEVIRGPGGTQWGANAVNGVINVITRSAEATVGGLVHIGGGQEERAFGEVRWGEATGEDGAWRAYAKAADRDGGRPAAGPEYDDWTVGQAGFRLDRRLGPGRAITVHGDVYDGDFGDRDAIVSYAPPFTTQVHADAALSGANLLGRYRLERENGSEVQLQAWVDRTRRRELPLREVRNTLDLEVQHRSRSRSGAQQIVWGAGFRRSEDETDGTATARFVPADEATNLLHAFVQDEIRGPRDRLRLTVGTKLEHNDFSGFEWQPSVRVGWVPRADRFLWAAVSRAVRTPSRLEDAVELAALVGPGTFARIVGNRDFRSEKLVSVEAGARGTIGRSLGLSLSAFRNHHQDLLSIERAGDPFPEAEPGPPHQVVPLVLANGVRARSYGLEAEAGWDVRPWWRVTGLWSGLRLDVEQESWSTDTSQDALEGNTPRRMWSVRSSFDLPRGAKVDLVYRQVGALPSFQAPQFETLDLRVAWTLRPGLEVAAVGHDLLGDHPEIGAPAGRVEVERAVWGSVRWSF